MGKKINLFLLTIFFLLFSLSTHVLAVDCPVPDTGQTKCYDNTQEITCPQPGEPFYGQDAQYSCNSHSYTKLDENGNDLPDGATEWIMIRDNVTGLIWENKTDDDSIHDKDKTYDWQNAQDAFIATLNSQNFGGYSDWHLPTIIELAFLVDRDRCYPSINTTYFPNTMSSDYWSSTTNFVGFPYYAWLVYFGSGSMYSDYKSHDYIYVRAVRGGQSGSFDNFVDNGDGTVTDTDTGLMWQQATAPGTYVWQQALSYCENLTLAGHNDWRLPNINELQSLVEYEGASPSINTTYFPNTVSSDYWSSTTNANNPYDACFVYFFNGYMGSSYKSNFDNYVRAVRSGHCGSSDTSTTTTISGSTTSTISGSTTTTTINSTTTTTSPQTCISESIYGEDSDETELLRYLRDNVLSTTPEGQEIIRLYYEWSPMLVKAMEEDEEFKAQVKEMIDGVLAIVNCE